MEGYGREGKDDGKEERDYIYSYTSHNLCIQPFRNVYGKKESDEAEIGKMEKGKELRDNIVSACSTLI